ncbi:MAG: hypothetical protein WA071_28425 [Undibacterium umbellatum]|uniref:hypothetical protein n=1 Tax=Undibacterium umbellatum TaxID=2762300 RepID=UPI003BB4D4B1
MKNPFTLKKIQLPENLFRYSLLAVVITIHHLPTMAAEPPATNTIASASDDTAAQMLKSEIIKAIDDNAVSVIITSSLHQLSLDLINSRQNNATPALRKEDAIKLASILENLITGKKMYSDVTALHINYIGIDEGHPRSVQNFDFIQTPAGVFVLKRN